ncbi:hypothetical protein ACIXGO_23160, partial [Bacteroides fragilis]
VHFNTLTVGGRIVNNNTEITSTQSVQLKEGKSYTLKIQFKKGPGINVLESDINLTGNGCTAQDKKDLAKLIWADGNLKSTGASNNYVWTTSTDYGYYYTWNQDYNRNNIDPCARLNPTTYGSGWRTPSINELTKLSRCTNKIVTNKGVWFMNSSKGIFLTLAGGRGAGGCGTIGTHFVGEIGFYWSSDNNNSYFAHRLSLDARLTTLSIEIQAGGPVGDGHSVRCVKGTKQ